MQTINNDATLAQMDTEQDYCPLTDLIEEGRPDPCKWVDWIGEISDNFGMRKLVFKTRVKSGDGFENEVFSVEVKETDTAEQIANRVIQEVDGVYLHLKRLNEKED